MEFLVRCQGMWVGFVVDKTTQGQVFPLSVLPCKISTLNNGPFLCGNSTHLQLCLNSKTREKLLANAHSDWKRNSNTCRLIKPINITSPSFVSLRPCESTHEQNGMRVGLRYAGWPQRLQWGSSGCVVTAVVRLRRHETWSRALLTMRIRGTDSVT